MADGIPRYEQNREGTMYRISGGQWVRFSDVQARLEAADRLAEAAEKLIRPPELQDGKGIGLDRESWDSIAMDYAPELDNALAVYRSEAGE